MKLKKLIVGGALGAIIAIGGVALPAQAANKDGNIEVNEMGFYYSQFEAGARYDTNDKTATFCRFFDNCNFPETYVSAGAGQGSNVRNNSASVWNRKGQGARVYFSSYYSGINDYFSGNVQANLSAGLRNENASFQWV